MGSRPGATHLHRGGTGAEGPILVTLASPIDNGSADGTTAFSRALMFEIRAAPDQFYLQIHTETHQNGALRGQLRLSP